MKIYNLHLSQDAILWQSPEGTAGAAAGGVVTGTTRAFWMCSSRLLVIEGLADGRETL